MTFSDMEIAAGEKTSASSGLEVMADERCKTGVLARLKVTPCRSIRSFPSDATLSGYPYEMRCGKLYRYTIKPTFGPRRA